MSNVSINILPLLITRALLVTRPSRPRWHLLISITKPSLPESIEICCFAATLTSLSIILTHSDALILRIRDKLEVSIRQSGSSPISTLLEILGLCWCAACRLLRSRLDPWTWLDWWETAFKGSVFLTVLIDRSHILWRKVLCILNLALIRMSCTFCSKGWLHDVLCLTMISTYLLCIHL